MNIKFYESNDSLKNYFDEPLFSKYFNNITYIENSINEDEFNEIDYSTDIISVFVNCILDKSTLQKFPNLRCITTRSTGYNHIDIDYCKSNGIAVYNVPDYGSNTVAEYSLALILNLLRKVTESTLETKRSIFKQVTGRDLRGKTVGIIGTGKIGGSFAKLLKCFNVNIIANDITKSEELINLGVRYCTLDELFQNSDIISLHVPLLESTRSMINSKSLAKMKKGVIIVNTSRGGVININDLYESYINGHVSGIALDTFEDENTIIGESKTNYYSQNISVLLELNKFDNVIITPHNAYNTVEAISRMNEINANNILDFINGGLGNI